MKSKGMYVALAIVVLLGMPFAPLITGGEAEFGSECSIANVAPWIAESRFFQSNQTICMGESVVFAISVSDANGAMDVSSVTLILSDDGDISEDAISLQLERTETMNATTSTFGTTWTVADEIGLKNILITAHDSGNLTSDNNGVKVGTIELNPLMGFVVNDGTGGALTTISFPESGPGTLNLSANQNSIQVKNIGGLAISVSMHGTPLTCGNVTIPISNMRIDGILMSTTPQIIAENVEPSTSSFHNIYLDYPMGIPAGVYQGTIIFEITT